MSVGSLAKVLRRILGILALVTATLGARNASKTVPPVRKKAGKVPSKD